MSRSQGLPLEQPRRALTVLGSYVGAVVVVLLVAVALFDGPLVLIATGGLALLLLVPLAVVVPVPRPEPPRSTVPVLERPRPRDRPSTAPVAAPREGQPPVV